MSQCSNCHRTIGYFPEDNPPVCPNGRNVVVAEPTAVGRRSSTLGGVSAGSPTFQGDTD